MKNLHDILDCMNQIQIRVAVLAQRSHIVTIYFMDLEILNLTVQKEGSNRILMLPLNPLKLNIYISEVILDILSFICRAVQAGLLRLLGGSPLFFLVIIAELLSPIERGLYELADCIYDPEWWIIFRILVFDFDLVSLSLQKTEGGDEVLNLCI